MVLADLGSKVAVALRKMTQATVIDESVVKEMLMEICKALLQADVNVAQVKHLREQIKRNVDVESLASGPTPTLPRALTEEEQKAAAPAMIKLLRPLLGVFSNVRPEGVELIHELFIHLLHLISLFRESVDGPLHTFLKLDNCQLLPVKVLCQAVIVFFREF